MKNHIKFAMYTKFCETHVLYINHRIFLSLLLLSEFAYVGPTNLKLIEPIIILTGREYHQRLMMRDL